MEDRCLMDLKCHYLLFLIWLAVLFLITCKQKKIPNTHNQFISLFFSKIYFYDQSGRKARRMIGRWLVVGHRCFSILLVTGDELEVEGDIVVTWTKKALWLVLGEAMVEISVREYGCCVWLLVGRNDGDRF